MPSSFAGDISNASRNQPTGAIGAIAIQRMNACDYLADNVARHNCDLDALRERPGHDGNGMWRRAAQCKD